MLSSLRLLDFRCFESLSLDLGENGAIFVGDNAQGKTSILEAVCVLMRLHSPRAKRMQPLVRSAADGYGVAGEVVDLRGDEISLRVRYAKGKPKLQRDGEEVATQGEYLGSSGLVVWMGNEDVELVRGSGGVRRHYLDFLCSQVDGTYRQALSRYRRVLKARNMLLKDGRQNDAEINAYSELLVQYGDILGVVRARLVNDLLARVAAAQVAISGRDEVLSLEYISGSGGDMRSALEATYESERRQRQTVAGPHRDELKILINGVSALDYGSEGQQRTVALAMKLAQGELLREQGGKFPIYLLDDIFGELDSSRRNALMNYLPSDAQKLITTTNLDWLKDAGEDFKQWQRYSVENGSVSLK